MSSRSAQVHMATANAAVIAEQARKGQAAAVEAAKKGSKKPKEANK